MKLVHILSAQLNHKVSKYTELSITQVKKSNTTSTLEASFVSSIITLPKDNHILTSNTIDLFCPL